MRLPKLPRQLMPKPPKAAPTIIGPAPTYPIETVAAYDYRIVQRNNRDRRTARDR